MITVTENAKSHALSLIKEENRPADSFIRVGVEGGGCSGLSYKLEFDNQMKDGDQALKIKELKLWWIVKVSFTWLALSLNTPAD